MGALTASAKILADFSCNARSQRYPMNPSLHPCSNHPTTSRIQCFDALCHLCGSRNCAGFANPSQTRQVARPNRVQVHSHAISGLQLRSRLLPTSPCGDAVTFCFSPVSHLRRVTTFTFCVHGVSFARGRRVAGASSPGHVSTRSLFPRPERVPHSAFLDRPSQTGSTIGSRFESALHPDPKAPKAAATADRCVRGLEGAASPALRAQDPCRSAPCFRVRSSPFRVP